MRELLPLAALLALAQRPAPVLAADAAAQPGPYCTVTGVSINLGRLSFPLDYGSNAPKPLKTNALSSSRKSRPCTPPPICSTTWAPAAGSW